MNPAERQVAALRAGYPRTIAATELLGEYVKTLGLTAEQVKRIGDHLEAILAAAVDEATVSMRSSIASLLGGIVDRAGRATAHLPPVVTVGHYLKATPGVKKAR